MSSSRRFRFVQAEFPWELGPEPGRYTIRERLGEAPHHVLVLVRLGASQARLAPSGRLRRFTAARARAAPTEPAPAAVVTTRATLVDVTALEHAPAAERWLRDADLHALAAAAVARLNRVLHAHRIATADPRAHEVAGGQALVVRVGYGGGEQVSDGRWDAARELPAGPRGYGRRDAELTSLRSQERLAAVLAGRDAVLACEELVLRARCDLDAERWREAALQLGVALDAALAELEPWRDAGGLSVRLDELRGLRPAVATASATALQRGLDEAQIEVVRHAVGRIQSALRARTARGL